MNNNSISTIADQQTITSMEIAKITGKNHFDVLKAIRKMEPAWEKTTASKFTCRMRINKLANGFEKEIPYYILTKTECLFVATKFNDVARAKLVLRWEQLEKEKLMQQPQQATVNTSNLPADPRNLTRKQLILMALEAEEENEKLRKEGDDLRAENMGLLIESGQKDIRIRNLEEQTAYLNAIMADRSHESVYAYCSLENSPAKEGIEVMPEPSIPPSSKPRSNIQSISIMMSTIKPSNSKIMPPNAHPIIMSVYILPLIVLLFFLHVLLIATFETLHLLSVTVKVLISLSA